MSRVYVISDLHFGHTNIHKFRLGLGLSSEEEHAEYIIDKWNSVVNKRDTVWVLGDACFYPEFMHRFDRMKGSKNIVLGNHDTDAKHFLPYFNKVCGFAKYRNAWLSHAPIHPEELRGRINIHGHTHFVNINHSSYFNACCENVNFKPHPIENFLIRGD